MHTLFYLYVVLTTVVSLIASPIVYFLYRMLKDASEERTKIVDAIIQRQIHDMRYRGKKVEPCLRTFQLIFHSLKTGSEDYVKEIIYWKTFLRNHTGLTLDDIGVTKRSIALIIKRGNGKAKKVGHCRLNEHYQELPDYATNINIGLSALAT